MCDSPIPLFDSVPINQDIVDKRIEKVAATSLSDKRHFKFEIAGTDELIDLSKSLILLKLKVVKADGTNLDADVEVALINHAGATLFEKLEIALGSGQDNVVNIDNYGYVGYLENKLMNSSDYNNTCGTLSGYYEDTPSHFETLNDNNLGFKARKAMCKNSRIFQLYSKLHSGVFNQPKPLKSHIDLTLEFTLADPDFYIMAPALNVQNTLKYRVEILEAHLVIKRLKLSNECNIKIEKAFQNNPIVYQFDRTRAWIKDVDTGLSTISFTDFCNKNDLPKFLMCGFVKENSFAGKQECNPFNFIPNKVKSINLSKNGTSITGKRLTMDYGRGNFSEAYYQFLESLGFWDGLEGCSTTPEAFSSGTTIYGFDLSTTCDGLNFVDQIRQGNMEIDVLFDGDTDQKTKFVVLNIYESQISINNMMRVEKNYTS